MTKNTIRIALTGASGRMGRMLTRAIAESEEASLVAASDHPASPHIGADIGSLNNMDEAGILIADTPHALLEAKPDVLIDFTAPEASIEHAMLAAEAKLPIVIGTTGFDEKGAAMLEKAAKSTPVVWCANTSVGVVMLARLVEEVAGALGEEWDIEITETHHRYKVDAPSGTALMLGETAAKGRGTKLSEVAEYERHGITAERKKGKIGMSSLRGGDVVGEHSVIFYGEGEELNLTHKARDRMIFARGALRAALWAVSAKAGLYSMKDVLK